MITQRWQPFGARSSGKPWRTAPDGPKTGFDGSCSNTSKLFITGAGSTALWGINHLWTSNKKPTNDERTRLKYCDHKKGGRENVSFGAFNLQEREANPAGDPIPRGCGSTAECGRAKAETTVRLRSPAPFPLGV